MRGQLLAAAAKPVKHRPPRVVPRERRTEAFADTAIPAGFLWTATGEALRSPVSSHSVLMFEKSIDGILARPVRYAAHK